MYSINIAFISSLPIGANFAVYVFNIPSTICKRMQREFETILFYLKYYDKSSNNLNIK